MPNPTSPRDASCRHFPRMVPSTPQDPGPRTQDPGPRLDALPSTDAPHHDLRRIELSSARWERTTLVTPAPIGTFCLTRGKPIGRSAELAKLTPKLLPTDNTPSLSPYQLELDRGPPPDSANLREWVDVEGDNGSLSLAVLRYSRRLP